MRFIYEWKPYQATKVFIVTLNEAYIEDMIEAALDTAWAVRNHRTPRRPPAAVQDPKKGSAEAASSTTTAGATMVKRRLVQSASSDAERWVEGLGFDLPDTPAVRCRCCPTTSPRSTTRI